MKPKILLVNPPIYDFAAYDFWLKPYGLLSVAGYLQKKADFELFDYLDRLHPLLKKQKNLQSDPWGRGTTGYLRRKLVRKSDPGHEPERRDLASPLCRKRRRHHQALRGWELRREFG